VRLPSKICRYFHDRQEFDMRYDGRAALRPGAAP